MKTPVLTDSQMRALKFTDRRTGWWYYVTRVGSGTTLDIFINKESGDYKVDVLNGDFGQPEYYGKMLEPYRTSTKEAIDNVIVHMNRSGLNLQINHALYGWEE